MIDLYGVQHQYATIIGDSYGGTERWQFGFRLTDGGVSNQATALAMSDDVQAWWLGTAPPYGGAAIFNSVGTHRLTELKVARIQPDGTYPAADPSYSHFYLPPIVGIGAPNNGQLPQGTLAITLTTAMPRGLASKGRIYLPPSQLYSPAADGRLPIENTTLITTSVKVLIDAINANGVVGNVAIFSKGKAVRVDNPGKKRWEYTYPTAGPWNVVTGVRGGRVVDTQRRRRRSLAEGPVAVAL